MKLDRQQADRAAAETLEHMRVKLIAAIGTAAHLGNAAEYDLLQSLLCDMLDYHKDMMYEIYASYRQKEEQNGKEQ